MQPRPDPITGGHPTPHEDVNALLRMLQGDVTRILGHSLVGMYLTGSLALGNLTAGSDVDVVVATQGELAAETLAALRAMHQRLYATGMRWSDQLEVDYIPLAALRRHDPARAEYPHLTRGPGQHLQVITHYADSVVHRVILRERGIVLAGPPPAALIDPITPDALRGAQVEFLRFWWAPMAGEGAAADFLRPSGHQSLAVLTMCRILYTLRTGAIISKSAAARWGLATLDPRWSGLIERADAWRADHPPDDSVLAPEHEIRETQALIRLVGEECEARRAQDEAGARN